VPCPISPTGKRPRALRATRVSIADVYEARMLLEPACARLLARRRTERDLADVGACADELRAQAEVPEPGRWSGLAYRFHELGRHLLREDLQNRSVLDLFA
jgi:DNA-binding GntR family transcriptional regulator